MRRSLTRNLSLSKPQKKLLSLVVIATVSLYMLFSFIFSDLGLIKYRYMKREYNRVRTDITRLQEENKNLREEVGSLKTDPDYIEALAREKLGLVKEGEIIYRFQEKEKEKVDE